MRNTDAEDVRRILFQDFCNHRDRLRKVSNNPTLELTPPFEKRVINLARQSYRQREHLHTLHWFTTLMRETDEFFEVLKFKDWPLMRGK